MAISKKTAIFSEPKCLVTGVEGAGKTLLAVQQADLLTNEEGGHLYQLNIRGADPGHLPKLPFAIDAMAFHENGSPVIDKETGDHLPKWATLPEGTVILIDEAHKVYPQRGPGRPPKHIEMLAEGRQHGIRFILLTQSPASLDSFLRDRISRHYHLERKGNMQRATVFEFDHCVMFPRTAWQERKDATVHFWTYPKEYFGWYTSAKSHHFKLRIPLKVVAALAFVPIAGFIAWKVVSTVGSLTSTATAATLAPGQEVVSPGENRSHRESSRSNAIEMTGDVDAYNKQFEPVVPYKPWSAPAYQGREVTAEPDLFCMAAGAGQDANGRHVEASCTCKTEQNTPYALDQKQCEIYARAGIYNPYRGGRNSRSDRSSEAGGKPEKPRQSASGVRPQASMIESTDAAVGLSETVAGV